MKHYYPTIGIEIHCQLNTKTKMFCSCSNDSRGAEPNTNICPICLGFPGSLPVVNGEAIRKAIILGLGLKGTIAKTTKFDRKNYFYPDLPKGYQISQYDQPIVTDGAIGIRADDADIVIGIERAHMEEDAAKLIHPAGADYSLVDYNRGGTPLVEIVSKPEMHTPAQARAYLQAIYNTAIALGVTDGNMEEGNFKFDLNVSVSSNKDALGTKVELKNLNSFRFAERALAYEIKRQTQLLDDGGVIDQETRGYNDAKNTTFSQRGKEAAHDYRYFPEPDIPPLVIKTELVDEIAASLAETPASKAKRYTQVGLNEGQTAVIVANPVFYHVFDLALEQFGDKSGDYAAALAKLIVNNKELKDALLHIADDKAALSTTADNLVYATTQLVDGTLERAQLAKILIDLVSVESMKTKVDELANNSTDDEAKLAQIIEEIISANSKAVADYKSGNDNALRFLIGQVMKQSKGQASPSKANELMRKYLSNE